VTMGDNYDKKMRPVADAMITAQQQAIDEGRSHIAIIRLTVAQMPVEALGPESVMGYAYGLAAVAERIGGYTRDELLALVGEALDLFAASRGETL